jgi:hypothetical protein
VVVAHRIERRITHKTTINVGPDKTTPATGRPQEESSTNSNGRRPVSSRAQLSSGTVDELEVELDPSALSRGFARAWLSEARAFAASLPGARHRAGGLFIVGTPTEEPWHLAAHLDQQARRTGRAGLAPTLVRYRVPAGTAPHLAIDLGRLEALTSHETVLVIAHDRAPDELLERLNDARRVGATILAIEADDPQLRELAHHALMIDESATSFAAPVAFEAGQHLVSAMAGQGPTRRRKNFWTRSS